MKLSRLSDRQLRRLIRNADVRFGDEPSEYDKKVISTHIENAKRGIERVMTCLRNEGEWIDWMRPVTIETYKIIYRSPELKKIRNITNEIFAKLREMKSLYKDVEKYQ